MLIRIITPNLPTEHVSLAQAIRACRAERVDLARREPLVLVPDLDREVVGGGEGGDGGGDEQSCNGVHSGGLMSSSGDCSIGYL